MRFARLRLAGFKSFVEPAELVIADGLTGIVGPNGCGKSNLLEAIRWAMGESSARSLRAAAGTEGMDAVIFAGTARRPARNVAEVTLTLENNLKKALPPFQDADMLDVSRTIWRGEGSSYAINGREVRQKDVQLLFADAATGAQSPALVSQNRVAHIIAARPSERRLLLEEAAGISGLAVRRKEAETRLRATDANLARLDDVMQAEEARLSALKRQAKGAERYRDISARIRAAEMALLRLDWDGARRKLADAEAAIQALDSQLSEAGQAVTGAADARARLVALLPSLRDAEAGALVAVQESGARKAALIAGKRALDQRVRDLERALAAAEATVGREEAQLRDSAATRARLAEEKAELEKRIALAERTIPAEADMVRAAEARAVETERLLGEAIEAHAAIIAESKATRAQAEAAQGRAQRIAAERRRLEAERAASADDAPALKLAADIADAEARIAAFVDAAEQAAAAIAAAESDYQALLRARETVERALSSARTELQSLEAESAALARLKAGSAKSAARIALQVDAGYEAAAAAAIGDDIHASVGETPKREKNWRMLSPGTPDPALPNGMQPLSGHVRGPAELSRRLAQVAIADTPPSAGMLKMLRAGQRIVSRDGWLWRWDGFVAPPGGQAVEVAESLAQENRLRDIAEAIERPREAVRIAETEVAALKEKLAAAQKADREARARRHEAERGREQAMARLQGLRAAAAQQEARRGALDAAIERLAAEGGDADAEAARATGAVRRLPDSQAAAHAVGERRTAAERSRADLAATRARMATTERSRTEAAQRLDMVQRESREWDRRDGEAAGATAAARERMEALRAELATIDCDPESWDRRLSDLDRELARDEEARAEAGAKVREAERQLAGLENALAAAQASVADLRERRASVAAAIDQARDAMNMHRSAAVERFGCQPTQIAVPEGADTESLRRELARIGSERERMGVVNLRADIELKEVTERLSERAREREELLTAIARLRGSIGSLNREGRARLLQAFAEIDRHFRELFVTLFEGGAAELQLVESDDPLDAGLEIRAQPPGKKLQSLSLLSGGEQALTACALIFSLFLTNPAPICVLDEVDAPLDDANVERFTHLLDHMVSLTQTRFLIVTHNPVTMSRMHRLFGVTMGEAGVSQLVSIDLSHAEALLAA